MSDMVPEILNAALDSLFTPKEPGEREYQGEDGLLYCRNCHTPVQCRVKLWGRDRIVPCLCRCQQEAMAEKKRQDELVERQRMSVREHWINVRVNPEELARIREKQKELGIRNTGAYMRKMAMDGYCVNLDLSDVAQVSTLLRRCSNNLNQYAKRANESGSIYAEDIRDLQKRMDELWEMQKLILKRLSAIR